MVGKRKVSEEQKEIFVKFIAANPCCWSNSAQTCKKRAAQWSELTTLLNEAEGCSKTPRQWRDYWNNVKYTIRTKATQIARLKDPWDGIGKQRVAWTESELRMFAVIPLEQFLATAVCNIDGSSPNLTHSVSMPLRVTSLTPSPPSSFLPGEHLNKERELPAKTLHLQPDTHSPMFKLDLPTPTSFLPAEKHPPAFKSHPPEQTLSLLPDKCSPVAKQSLSLKMPFLPQEKYSPTFKSRLPEQAPSLQEEDTTSFTVTPDIMPLQVAIITANMSRMPFEEIVLLQKMLQEKIWDFMANPTTSCQPEFASCSRLEPFGLVFKCCNEDALEWLTTTIGHSPFIERNLVVFLDSPGKLPTTVDMCVELTSDFELNKEPRSIFNVLVRTNKSWLDTEKWTLLECKCSSPTADSAYPAELNLVFSVPLPDVPKMRERGFKLHFLFGVLPVDFYDEVKRKASDSQITIKLECLK